MKARTLSSIFLNLSILSYRFLNIHQYSAFGSKLPHTFFYSVSLSQSGALCSPYLYLTELSLISYVKQMENILPMSPGLGQGKLMHYDEILK
jgi:hypothetical protein